MKIKNIVICFFILSCIIACKKNDNQVEINGLSATNSEIDSPKLLRERKILAGDALQTSSIGEPINMIPAISADSASHEVAGYIYNGLVKYDKNLNLVGDLAEKWEVSSDNKTITFYLRKNVLWHDGTPFTAEDVKFTYEFMTSDSTPTSYDGDFRKISDFQVIDDYTVKISYSAPYAPAISSWGMWIMPCHLLKDTPCTKSPLQRKPIGTGPYILEEWDTGKSITLKANERYFEGRPNLDKVIIRIIPDQSTQFMELLNGSIDIMALNPMQASKQTDNQRYISQYKTYSTLDNAYTYVGYNLRKEPFSDKRVRQALSYATPIQDIITGVLFNKGLDATGPYKPGTYWYNENVKKYEYNIEKAKALLNDAGWIDKNNQGVREKNGKKLTFELLTNQGNTARAQIATVLQRSWAEIGVKVEIRILEWATLINEYINKGNFSAIVMGWNIVQDPDLFDVWSSERCGGNGLNFICFQNEEVDNLLLAGQSTLDNKERKKAYDKIQEILAEEQPYTFLYVPYSNTALHKRFKNIEEAPSGITHNFIDWYVDKNDQKYHFE